MALIVYEDQDGNVVQEQHDRLTYEDSGHWYWNSESDEDVRVHIPRERVVRVEKPTPQRRVTRRTGGESEE